MVSQCHNTLMEAQGERGYSFYSFTTSSVNGGEWSASRPGRALPPGKGPPVPFVQKAGWTRGPVWSQRLEEKSPYSCRGSNLDRPLVQSVARQYTDWATPAPKLYWPTQSFSPVNLDGLYAIYTKKKLNCLNSEINHMSDETRDMRRRAWKWAALVRAVTHLIGRW
jgi:hypothetical protein